MKSLLTLAVPSVAVLTGLAGVHGVAQAEASRALTPAELNMMARVSDPQVSPNGRYVVYVQRETDLDANRGRNDL